MGKTAKRRVIVHTPEGAVRYNPGDDVPNEHVKLIQSESVWKEDEPTPSQAPPPAEPSGGTGDGEYAELSVKQLGQMIRDRGLEVDGKRKKDDLVSILESDDLAKAEVD